MNSRIKNQIAFAVLGCLFASAIGFSPRATAQDPPRFQPPSPPPLDQDFDDPVEDDMDSDDAPARARQDPPPMDNPAPPPVNDYRPPPSYSSTNSKVKFKVVDGAFYEKGKKRGRTPQSTRQR